MFLRLLLQGPLPDALALRWEVLLGGLALVAIYLVVRARSDIARAMGFTAGDVWLLTLGTVAAQVLNVPLFVAGDALFAVNLGGVLVPLLLVARLAHRGRLPPLATLLGVVSVAVVTALVVEVRPDQGAVVPFPMFLAPPGVALLAGLVLSRARPILAGPLAFASGSLGVLVGADLIQLPAFLAAARAMPAGTAMVLGGGGAFDLVFLSGAMGLALSFVLAGLTTRRDETRAPATGTGAVRIPDPLAVVRQAQDLPGVSPRERCVVFLARADTHLTRGQLQAGVAEAHRGVEAMLSSGRPTLLSRLRQEGEGELLTMVRELNRAAHTATTQTPTWLEAGESLELAKQLAGRLWPRVPGHVRIQGVST
ncbi:MAG: DUF1614 domain-containing protein [Candidatus Thermoplasmatota archaeon]|nr:DUF1614 domain-containing protein [Candidatus Thermoplasmatota archaeon]